MNSARGFDRLSGVYDRLAGLVYGRSLRRAQTCMLGRLAAGKRILVVGGGTGWFLEALLREGRPEKVLYVELSEGMMGKSRERIRRMGLEGEEVVEWHLGTLQEVKGGEKYDLVCTHCFLDLFEGERLLKEVDEIDRLLYDDAEWYFSDFRQVERGAMRWVSRLLIGTMYAFFRWFCGIQARRLGDFDGAIQGKGFEKAREETFFGGMIQAVWYGRGEKAGK